MATETPTELRRVRRPHEQETNLFWETPILIVDSLIGLQLVHHRANNIEGSRLVIAAPRSLYITFDREDGSPVFHRTREMGGDDDPNRISARREGFNNRRGKKRFFIGDDYAFTYLESWEDRIRLKVASTKILHLTQTPADHYIGEILQRLRQS